jgi:hypothetical protein
VQRVVCVALVLAGCCEGVALPAMRLTLTDVHGTPVTDAQVGCSLGLGTRVGHEEGPNTGIYDCGESAGAWSVTIAWRGNEVARAAVEVARATQCDDPLTMSLAMTLPIDATSDAGQPIDASVDH